MRCSRRRGLGWAIALAALLAGCADPQPAKVVLVGIDGATFRVLDPLRERGRLPVLAALMEAGSYGVLRSRKPMISPALWTTIATGRLREDHGIDNFTIRMEEGGRQTLVSARERRVPALWNYASAFGRPVGFLGWWSSWPAEPVVGWMVSDRATRTRWGEWTHSGATEQIAFPPALADTVRSLVVDPARPPMEEIESLAAWSDAERLEIAAATEPIIHHGPSVFKFAWCSQRSYERIAIELLDEGAQPDLVGILLIANDPVSHTFWHYYEPGRYPGVDRGEARRLGGLIPAIYRHNDAFLGALRERLDPDTVLLIVSDHGFRASGRLPALEDAGRYARSFAAEAREDLTDVVAVGQSGRHDPAGIWIASGGPIVAGGRGRLRQIDIAPTVLALLGLPVPAELPGRVVEEIIDPGYLERFPVRVVEAYPDSAYRPAPAAEGEEPDEEALEMLRALGYIEPESD